MHDSSPTGAPGSPDPTTASLGLPGAAGDPPPQEEAARLREEVAQLREEVAQLRAALSRRPVIDLAKGVVMALTGCDETQAFRELSQISQTHNVKLHDLATGLLADLPAVRDGGGVLRRRDWGQTS